MQRAIPIQFNYDQCLYSRGNISHSDIQQLCHFRLTRRPLAIRPYNYQNQPTSQIAVGKKLFFAFRTFSLSSKGSISRKKNLRRDTCCQFFHRYISYLLGAKRRWPASPCHLAPERRKAGILRYVMHGTSTELTASPFVVTVIATNFVPLPVASTLALTRREPSPPL